VRQWRWGNGTLSARTYDQDGRVSQIDSQEFYTLAYDAADRITGITNTNNAAQSWSYGYDSRDRLTSASKTGTTLGWSYDANGNRTAQTGPAQTHTIAATSNRLSSLTGTPARTYSYTAAGQVLSSGTAAGATVHTYNHAGRMKSGRLASTSTNTTYLYNALGQRIRKQGGSPGTVLFVYDDQGHLLGEYSSTGALVQETLWLGDIPVATLRPKSGGGIDLFYVHSDHLNTPRKVTRPSDNQLRWRWDPDPFGTGAANQNPQGLGTFIYHLRLPGQYFDTETALHYNYFRDYDPQTGRYLESDPIGLQGGINTYGYVGGNPVSRFDPFGLSSCTEFVNTLIALWSSINSSTNLGSEMLARRSTTLRTYDGFKNQLVNGGQGGAVSRHIYGHAGAVLAYPYGLGATVSYGNQALDYLQQYGKGRTAAEAAAEVANDRAARHVADALNGAMKIRLEQQAKYENQCIDIRGISDDLKKLLESILCKN
jgi:RHS repeat-associated protein